jgi:hypothetical protein
MIMRSFTKRVKKMWWLMLFPGNMKKKVPSFPSHSLSLTGFRIYARNGCTTQNIQPHPKIATGSSSCSRYSWHNEEFLYKGRLYLSKQSALKSKVLSEFHASPTAGHSGFTKTYEWVKCSFFWDGMKQDVHTFVEECDICQCNKGETVKTPGTLQPLRFHLLFGRIFLWISLWAYPNQEISQSSWW